MKKRLPLCLIFCLLVVVLVSGCSTSQNSSDRKKETKEVLKSNEIIVYYLSHDKTKLIQKVEKIQSNKPKEKVEEAIKKIRNVETNLEYQTPFSIGLVVDKILLEKNQLYLYFNKEYENLDNVQEVLLRAAIVRTVVQIKGVDCVSFYVNDLPLEDHSNKMVGIMTKDSFVENIGAQINSINTTNITLYYATEDGNKMVAVDQNVYTSSNVSKEKLVLEHLLEKPKQEGVLKAIPDGTQLLSVSTMDGICFVNLDAGFLKYNFNISEPVVIYSIVNTLCELSTVNKVQISVNGETKIKYREKMGLDEIYERNLDLVLDLDKYLKTLGE